jgi:predicted nucleic-acid-binding Zn-ribbon protein
MKKGTIKKRCPKCGGNMFFQRDESIGYKSEYYQWCGWCLQCGYTLYVRPEPAKASNLVKEKVQL